VRDESLCAELPKEIEIIRTPHIDPVVAFSRQQPLQSNGAGGNRNGGKRDDSQRNGARSLREIAKAGWITLDHRVLIPDQTLLWHPRAVAAGLAAHARRSFDVIYATGDPFSVYFIAMTISGLTAVPFVIDMRDPWTVEPFRAESRSPLRLGVERLQEYMVLSACRACVFAFRHTELYNDRFPELVHKFHYLPNGYDAADFEDVVPLTFNKFTIVHSGTFLPGYRTPDNFLQTLRELLNEQPDLSNRIQLLFVGRSGTENEVIERFSLSNVVKQVGYLPHRESIRYLKGADLLLLIGGKNLSEETGKVYEYIAAGKPILASIRPDGAAAKVLRDYPLARVIDRENQAALRDSLRRALTNGHSTTASIDPEWRMQFERSRLTDRLAEIMQQCL
jgi:glycosyltransferase involved in cell wall biosynthesis